ncbi:MAG: TonB C-terminal domain-containing protein [Vampirovibrio sp.]|nr:TonB C-terminal domain-containing protein [Vampirovibrio sp.]
MMLKQLGWLSTFLLLIVGVGQAYATDWHDPWKKEAPAVAGQRSYKPVPVLKNDESASQLDPTVRYIERVTARLRKNWIPLSANTEMNCAVVTLFDVNSMGLMVDTKLLSSSCSPQMTQSAWATLKANEQLPKPPRLPKFPIRIEFSFDYVATH